MSNYDKEKDQLKLIAKYFSKSGLDFKWVDFDFGHGFVKPVIVSSNQYQDVPLDIVASAQSAEGVDDWLTLRVFLCKVDNLDKDKLLDLLKLCLQLNFEIPETTFSMKGNMIFLEADMPTNISEKDFQFELDGMDFGIPLLFNGMKKLGLSINPTKGTIN
ncbi:MAG: hypothetical protein ACTSPY_10800 [Candidatus Helarchaeota archaeon]